MHQESFINQNFKSIYISIFVISLAFMCYYTQHQVLSGDEIQMLLKGYSGVVLGSWESHGNAASAVGSVPGSLTTLVVGLPLLLWNSPWSPMILLLILRITSFFIFDNIIKQTFSKSARLTFMLFYLLNPWFLFDTRLYNPSYLCFFASLHLFSAFKQQEKSSVFYSALHVIAIGMALQFHYSWPLLAVISLFILYRNMAKVSWIGVAIGALIVLASLVPYILEIMQNPSLTTKESDRYIGYGLVHVYPILKGILYWVRYASFLFTHKLISQAEFPYLVQYPVLQTIINYTWQGALYIIGGLSVISACKINWQALLTVKPLIKRSTKQLDNKEWILLYTFSAVIAIIVNAALSPITFSYWHLIMLFPISLFPILLFVDVYFKRTRTKFKFKPVFLSIFIYFLVVNINAANDSFKYSYKANYNNQVFKFLEKNNLNRD